MSLTRDATPVSYPLGSGCDARCLLRARGWHQARQVGVDHHGNELLTLNGLDYSVNNHSPGARYMATGKLDSMAYPTFAALPYVRCN